MIAGLQAAILIAIAMLAGACLVWLIAIGCIELGDLIHRLASKSRDTD